MSTDWLKDYHETTAREGAAGKAYLLGLIPMLKEAGVSKLTVHYNGEGDSGDIEDIEAFDSQEKVVKISLDEDAVGDAATGVLSGKGIDWYNNEGGYGDVVVLVEQNKIAIHHNYSIETSEYSEIEG